MVFFNNLSPLFLLISFYSDNIVCEFPIGLCISANLDLFYSKKQFISFYPNKIDCEFLY